MAKGKIHHVIDHYRAQLAAREKQAEQALEHFYAHTLSNNIQPTLNKLYDEMTDAMGNGEKIPLHWLYEAQRLENIKTLIETQISHFGEMARMTVGQLQRWAVQTGEMAAHEMLHATLPNGVKWTFGVADPQAIVNLVGATQSGSPLADLFEGFGREAAQKAEQALVNGLILGDNPRKVASSVQQALGVSRNRALTISRTEMLRSYRDASISTYQANSDICGKWRWTCSNSSRTCGMCLAMDGQEFDVGEPFESHCNCRCSPLPVTRSWSDIMSGAGLDGSSIDEASLDMPPASDWFDQQDEATQLQVLGPSKLAAYNDGSLQLSDLVYHGHDPNWGGYRREKSLKEVLGAKQAQQYYANAR